jgi:hypothetical protein
MRVEDRNTQQQLIKSGHDRPPIHFLSQGSPGPKRRRLSFDAAGNQLRPRAKPALGSGSCASNAARRRKSNRS